MNSKSYKYIIIGGGLAGASAVKGIRELDPKGPALLVGSEKHLPYDRPPLTKQLWWGKKKVEEIFLNDRSFYERNNVELSLATKVDSIDPDGKEIRIGAAAIKFEKLLIATGGIPRSLPITGSDLEGIVYYRDLDDYEKVKAKTGKGKSAVIIGGGFIGSELAASLNMNGVDVTMIFPGELLVDRVFPKDLGSKLTAAYRERGIKVLAGEKPERFEKNADKFITHTAKGRVESEVLIVGVGIAPETDLAKSARLTIENGENGVIVNAFLQTSHPDIYAAGDNAFFPYEVLGKGMRVEHWDNALNQGTFAGRNMAGNMDRYDYMPYFFSDLFEFGYEAVGDVNSSLETKAVWEKEFEKGIIYYLANGKIRGIMLCNIWERIPAAREIILSSTGFDSLGGGISILSSVLTSGR